MVEGELYARLNSTKCLEWLKGKVETLRHAISTEPSREEMTLDPLELALNIVSHSLPQRWLERLFEAYRLDLPPLEDPLLFLCFVLGWGPSR